MINNIITNFKKIRLKPFFNESNNIKEKKTYDGVFYRVERDEKYFYVGGSVHIGKKKNILFNDAVEKAYKDSTKIAVELDITKLTNKINLFKSFSNISESQIRSDNRNFKLDLLQPENKIKYESLCKSLGLDSEKCSKLSPESFYSIAQKSFMEKAGYKSNYGIDKLFIDKAKNNRKAIVSLETPSIQVDAIIAMMNTSPEFQSSAGKKIECLEDLEASIQLITKLHDSVFEGDTLNLVNKLLIYKPANKSDIDNLNIFLYQRNERMASKIESLIASKEIYFVIVGVAHVIGKGGLLKIFKDKGYKISRLK